jgi:hypothetical protein
MDMLLDHPRLRRRNVYDITRKRRLRRGGMENALDIAEKPVNILARDSEMSLLGGRLTPQGAVVQRDRVRVRA